MNSESQDEELEVLRSIYEGDESFKELNPKTFQYKVKGILFDVFFFCFPNFKVFVYFVKTLFFLSYIQYGSDGSPHSFVLEINWPEAYPDSLPIVSMDAFYNKHL